MKRSRSNLGHRPWNCTEGIDVNYLQSYVRRMSYRVMTSGPRINEAGVNLFDLEGRSKTMSFLKINFYCCHAGLRLKLKVNFTQEQATKPQRGSRDITILFL
jgi:hypothetical protein